MGVGGGWAGVEGGRQGDCFSRCLVDKWGARAGVGCDKHAPRKGRFEPGSLLGPWIE